MENLRLHLPTVTLRSMTILPGTVIHFDISNERSMLAIEEAMRRDQKVFLVTQRPAVERVMGVEQVYMIGTIAKVKQVSRLPKNISRVLVRGESRGMLVDFSTLTPIIESEVECVPETRVLPISSIKEQAMMRILLEAYQSYALTNKRLPQEAVKQAESMRSLPTLVDRICADIPFYYEDQQKLLEAIDIQERYDILLAIINRELDILYMKNELQEKVKERIDKNQREYYLREQLKVIREELGENSTESDVAEWKEKLEELEAPDEVKEKIKKEIHRFETLTGNNAETGVIRTYIETMLEMPWNKRSKDSEDLEAAARILDEDHYGLADVKERVLEFLAVRALSKKGVSPILCLVGPPGTGKSSIARSIARALNKEYVRIALGGIRDEAEIRGHRKTYVGAMPGRIANALRQAGVSNPLMLLDEVDKVSMDFNHGDTFSALLEVLDSEQNDRFRDHYLEVPLDLTEVMFITTANTTQTIPRPLLDRMELIEVSSYTENEKVHIALEHLLPRQKEQNGLKRSQLSIGKTAMAKIARNYTKEAGVRTLERTIGEICRKAAREIYEGKKAKVTISPGNLAEYLGNEKYSYRKANRGDDIGIARGLAWTPVGGDTLQIEVNGMPGKGSIILTGQLGDVMKESAQAAISYLRSISEEYKIDPAYFQEHDIHVHVPAGAVPKDGPSAGITMATAIFSAATGRPVKASVAMTGEITLRGRVLPIGGLKEKLLAAKNAGIKTVIVPQENEMDVKEIDKEITEGLEIVFVDQMKQVLKCAIARKK